VKPTKFGPPKPPSYATCPWCSRKGVKIQKGKYYPHVDAAGKKCVGSGMQWLYRHRAEAEET